MTYLNLEGYGTGRASPGVNGTPLISASFVFPTWMTHTMASTVNKYSPLGSEDTYLPPSLAFDHTWLMYREKTGKKMNLKLWRLRKCWGQGIVLPSILCILVSGNDKQCQKGSSWTDGCRARPWVFSFAESVNLNCMAYSTALTTSVETGVITREVTQWCDYWESTCTPKMYNLAQMLKI